MRLLVLSALAALVMMACPAVARDAGGDKGPMEKAGKFLDQGVIRARDFLSDSAITARIKRRLMEDEFVSVFDIKITTVDQRVIVEGDVKNEELATRTMGIVRATEGVKDAENHLMIYTQTPSKVK